MPLLDRPEFRAWLDRRNEGRIGESHDPPTICSNCRGPLTPEVDAEECLVCLAEQFGSETAEAWLADVIAGFARAAVTDRRVLAQMLAELVGHAGEIVELHAPPAESV